MKKISALSQTIFCCKDGEGRPVSNFYPKVIKRLAVKGMEGIENSEIRVCMRLCFPSGESSEIVVSENDIGRIDWDKLDMRCILNPHYRQAKEYLWNVIRSELASVPLETIYHIDGLGIRNIDDAIFFLAGDHIITPTNGNKIESNIELGDSLFKLQIDTNFTKREVFEGMWELINLSPETGRILVAHVISGIVREAFIDAGFTPCSVLIVMGESGLLKSTYIPHLTQLYNRADGIKAETRFNSTDRFIEDVLCEYRECTAVIDDLHTAESGKIRKKNEDTAEEIIRRIGDDTGRGHKEGNTLVQKKFGGNVVFIGEYLIGKASTIPRALVVNLTKRPDGRILDIYQRHKPLLVSTFYYHFIQWYVDNFNEIRETIDEMLTAFRREGTDVEIHGRLRDTLFYLRTSYMFFLQFCCDSNFISEAQSVKEFKDFNDQLSELIQEQQARFRRDKEKSEDIDYLKLIRKFYKKGKFHLADSADTFRPDKHDGLIYYGCLCLRREKLEKKFHKISPDIRIDDVIKSLVDKRALKLVSDKHTVKIATLNKEVGAMRFYAIWLNKLE